jgi:hypothetical protein
MLKLWKLICNDFLQANYIFNAGDEYNYVQSEILLQFVKYEFCFHLNYSFRIRSMSQKTPNDWSPLFVHHVYDHK